MGMPIKNCIATHLAKYREIIRHTLRIYIHLEKQVLENMENKASPPMEMLEKLISLINI